ncbi:MAG: 4Fe-4S dicluster domain-containing protein [Bryobacterales bacterium]|nr:4Fe-4S dicluster domain-containing protein [Bryobacterales bacterium]
MPVETAGVLQREALDTLIHELARRGYEVRGPTVQDGAIVFGPVQNATDLPVGWTDKQEPGRYRIGRSGNTAVFDFVVGPKSLKNEFHSPNVKLVEAEYTDGVFHILNPNHEQPPPRAFIGVRPCELAALAVQDRVFTGDMYPDPIYSRRRHVVFIIAVNCTRPAATCFCASMNTGPRATAGFDLALTEILDSDGHRFLVETGSPQGAELLAHIPLHPATEQDRTAAAHAIDAAARQRRHVDLNGLEESLKQNFEHPRWESTAERCLTCANCTMVCPTCFCTTVEDSSDIAGKRAERWRRWDSCFTMTFSYIHGGSIRTSAKARYRQWLSHKFAAWVDQFGTPGCVGCGRCITWCPAGIDVTEELSALRRMVANGDSIA